MKTGRRLKTVHEHTRARSQQRMTTGGDRKEQGSLTSYFNQPAARALARLRASPQAHSSGRGPINLGCFVVDLWERHLDYRAPYSDASTCATANAPLINDELSSNYQ